MLWTTHAELGAALLSRWGCQEVVDTIRFHDDPFQNSETRFCPASAVFLANLLEGAELLRIVMVSRMLPVKPICFDWACGIIFPIGKGACAIFRMFPSAR